MTRTKKALVTVAFSMAAAAGVSSPAFADFHATTVPVTTDDFHATTTPVTTDDFHATGISE